MLIMTSTTLANTPPQSSAILIAIDTESQRYCLTQTAV